MNLSKNTLGYTLFELIIVVTIIVILGTVWFISYSEFTITSRDGKRATDMVSLRGALTTYSSQNGGYPNPTGAVEIRANVSTGSTLLMRQGTLGAELASKIWVSGGGRDPSSNLPYTLSVDTNGKKAQILAYFEKAGAEKQLSLVGTSVFAADDLSERTVVTTGEKLGIFILTGSLIPLQENATGWVAATTLAGSGYLILDGCQRNNRLEPAYYTGALWEWACKNIPYISNVLNSQGQDGDEIIAYDERTYTHDPIVVAANGWNPDFFNKKYKLLKINGKWWMNQNLAYSTDVGTAICYFNTNFTSGPCETTDLGGGGWRWWYYNIQWCPHNSLWAEDCTKLPEQGYVYGSFWFAYIYKLTGVCPNGWHLPSQAEWISLNSWANWISPVLQNWKWRLTPIYWTNPLYWPINNPNTYQTDNIFSSIMYTINQSDPTTFTSVTFPYPWSMDNGSIRCVRN